MCCDSFLIKTQAPRDYEETYGRHKERAHRNAINLVDPEMENIVTPGG
jgi:hypothetical protein